MNLPLDVYVWQALRKLVREGPCVGRALRVSPSRRTVDGKFLVKMVTYGLISVVNSSNVADPFSKVYELTELGMKAAEFGEFEIDPKLYSQVV